MRRRVRIDELAAGMRITAVTGFSSEYTVLDSGTVARLKAELAGARADIRRKGQDLAASVAELQPFDELLALKELPAGWPEAVVEADSIDRFRKRGFMVFEIEEPEGAARPAAPARAAAKDSPSDRVRKAVRLVESVRRAGELRQKGAQRVEELMDNGRVGRISTAGVMEAVNELVREESTKAVKAIAGLKASDQTYAHCVDVASIFQDTVVELRSLSGQTVPASEQRALLTAGFLHDIGKCRIPKDILDSTARFAPDSREMRIMRSHVTHGARILTNLGMDAVTVNLAHYHHVKVDMGLTACYPKVPFDQVHPHTRLGAIVDVYQALIGRRSYKKSWVPAKAVGLIEGLSGKEFDQGAVTSFLRILGRYPVGTLLRLSTGEVAFVIGEAMDVVERPVVAVVENAQGERLTHNTVIDLLDEPEVEISEVLDHFEYYGDSSDQAYEVFCALSL